MSGWYIRRADGSRGPVSDAILRELARRGELSPTDLIWKEGMSSWVQAAKARGLFSSFAAANRDLSGIVSSSGHAPPAAGHQPQTATGHAPPATGQQPQTATGHAPPAAGHQPQTATGHAPPPASPEQPQNVSNQLGSLIDDFADLSKKFLAGAAQKSPDASSASPSSASQQQDQQRSEAPRTSLDVKQPQHPSSQHAVTAGKRPAPVPTGAPVKPSAPSRWSGAPLGKTATARKRQAGSSASFAGTGAEESGADNYTAMLISQYDQAKKGKKSGKPVFITGRTLKQYEEGQTRTKKVLAYMGLTCIILFALGMTTYSLAFMPDKQVQTTVAVECIKCGHQQTLSPDALVIDSMGRQCANCPNCGGKQTAFLAMQCPNCGKYFISEADKAILAKSGSLYSKSLNCPHCGTNPAEWYKKHRK